jgi:carboxypeptidase C (cathepsin A)
MATRVLESIPTSVFRLTYLPSYYNNQVILSLLILDRKDIKRKDDDSSSESDPTDIPVMEGYELRYNPYAWNEIADVIFVEQPIRTGYSQAAEGARSIRNEKQMASDFYGFLRSVIKVFPEYTTAPIFVSGESYAGAYIPWIADYIVHANEELHYRKIYWPSGIDPDEQPINLQGVAIGNGIINFIIQVIIEINIIIRYFI